MHKIRNSDGSIMVFGDGSSPLDHEKYQWRYENGQDIDPSMSGAPIEIKDSNGQLLGAYTDPRTAKPVTTRPTSHILDASAALREADLMRPEGVPRNTGKFKGGAQVADVTVHLYPKAAGGLGHAGLQIDNDPSYGHYPRDGSDLFTLMGVEQTGEVRKDEISKLGGEVESHRIKTTPEQDRIIREFIRKRFAEPGGYDFYLRNCQDFVSEALGTAGIKLKPGAYPVQWFNINFAQPALNAAARKTK